MLLARARRLQGRQHAKEPRNYWNSKFERNRARDAENQRALEKVGWRVFTVWECETRDNEKLASHCCIPRPCQGEHWKKRGKTNGRI